MAIDNATLAQLLGGSGATTGGATSPYGSLGMLGNYLMQQGAPRSATLPAQQPAMGGGPARPQTSLPNFAATNPYQSANPYQGATGGGAATNSLGIDPLVAALLRAKLARGMGGAGSGGLGL